MAALELQKYLEGLGKYQKAAVVHLRAHAQFHGLNGMAQSAVAFCTLA